MKIIDINTMLHTLPDKFVSYLEEDRLLERLDEYNITSAISFSAKTYYSPKQGNMEIVQVSQRNQGRIHSCFVLDPMLQNTNLEGFKSLKEGLNTLKPSAIRLLPTKQNYILNSFYCGELLSLLNDCHLPVLLSNDIPSLFEVIPQLSSDYPNIQWVLLGQGFRVVRSIVPLLKNTKNVYFETSNFVEMGSLEYIIEQCGINKLVYGSGMPYSTWAGSLSIILYAQLSDSDKQAILACNWEKIGGNICYGNT